MTYEQWWHRYVQAQCQFLKAIKKIAALIVKLLVLLATLKHSHMLQRNFKVLVR
jgi:hypothetical protein